MIQNKHSAEDYVIVTGASAGIGTALARQFAQRGFSLVLTARRKDKLQQLATQLMQDYPIQVMVIVSDLSDPAAADQLFAQTNAANIKVSGLVNNAGYGIVGDFLDSAFEEYEAMMQVMLVSCVRLSYLYSPAMIERGYGWILNVSSLTALTPASHGVPLYSPIKKFLLDFSQSHGEELKSKGVNVTALCPGFTYTDFFADEKIRSEADVLPAYMWMEADLVAHQGVEAVLKGKSVYVNGKVNRFIAFLGKVLPDGVGRRLMAKSKQQE